MKKILTKRGFTLVELMVVVAIIAILTAIVTANFADSRAKARDAKRISDIGQIQLMLTQIYDKCHRYPTSLSTSSNFLTQAQCRPPGSTSDVTPGQYISSMPTDPKTKAVYEYAYNKTSSSAGFRKEYLLRAVLEKYSSILEDDVDDNTLGDGPASITINGPAIDCTEGANNTSPYNYCVKVR